MQRSAGFERPLVTSLDVIALPIHAVWPGPDPPHPARVSPGSSRKEQRRATADFLISSPLMDQSHQGWDPASAHDRHNQAVPRMSRQQRLQPHPLRITQVMPAQPPVIHAAIPGKISRL